MIVQPLEVLRRPERNRAGSLRFSARTIGHEPVVSRLPDRLLRPALKWSSYVALCANVAAATRPSEAGAVIGPSAPVPVKPALVWFKAQAPGFRNDGSSLVTLRLAEVLAERWELHLVCLQTRWTTADPSGTCCPPFDSVTVVEPAHARSRLHRLALGSWYRLIDVLGIRPAAVSIESSRPVRRAVSRRAAEVGAEAGLVEYWSSARVLRVMPSERILVLVDVEHENRLSAPGSSSALASLWLRLRAWRVRREEARSSTWAARTAVLSDEDSATFSVLGVRDLVRVAIPVPESELEPVANRPDRPPVVAALGGLSWWPNREGLEWLLANVWPLVLEAVPDAQLHVIGSTHGANPARAANPSVRYLGFVDDLAAALAEATVGVVPTRNGTGVKTKTLEMLAAGVPLVSTRNGVRGTSASTAGALIADDPAEFAEHLSRLLTDPALRLEVATAGREALRREHSGRDLADRLFP